MLYCSHPIRMKTTTLLSKKFHKVLPLPRGMNCKILYHACNIYSTWTPKHVLPPSIIPHSLNKEIKSHAHPVILRNNLTTKTHIRTNANTKPHVRQRMRMQLHLLKAQIYKHSYLNNVYKFIWRSSTPYSATWDSWNKKKKLKNRWA